MKKEELLNRMIRVYGFEHECVLEFANIMERMDKKTLETIVKAHEKFPQIKKEGE